MEMPRRDQGGIYACIQYKLGVCMRETVGDGANMCVCDIRNAAECQCRVKLMCQMSEEVSELSHPRGSQGVKDAHHALFRCLSAPSHNQRVFWRYLATGEK